MCEVILRIAGLVDFASSYFSSFEYVRQTYPIGSVKSSIKRDVKPKIESGVQFGD